LWQQIAQSLWEPAETHIAQLELSMVLYALIERPDLFRNRQSLWFLDNVAAVMTLVRGRSSSPDLAKLCHLIHLALFALRAQGYWEYVQSKSNSADDTSRTAQGGGGSFKNRKPIGEVGCCESGMAERSH